MIVLATPVRTLLGQLDEVGRCAKPGAVVLDLGSTKAAVCAAMDRPAATGFEPVGGHPMCGKETGRLCGGRRGPVHGQDLRPVSAAAHVGRRARNRALAGRGRGQPRRWSLDPAEHDRAVAAISHLPYLAAAGLVNAVAAGNDPLAWALAASGFRDTTRVAASDVQMMLDILMTNRDAVLEWLDLLQRRDVRRLRDRRWRQGMRMSCAGGWRRRRRLRSELKL